MKIVFAVFFMCLPLIAVAQSKLRFKVLNAETGKPMPRLSAIVLKDTIDYQIVYKSEMDTDGVYTLQMRDFDSTVTYQVEINNQYNAVKSGRYVIPAAITGKLAVLRVYPGNKAAPNPCGERMYGIHPKSIFAIADLPENVQANLKRTLLNRVGGKFYPRLILNLGQEIDVENFKKLIPQANNPDYNLPPTYSLCMSVLDTLTREEIYSFRVNLDKMGAIIDQLDIPDVRHHPAKAFILSEKEVKAIGEKNGLTNTYIRASFDAKKGSVIWKIEKMGYVGSEGGPTQFTILLIDAHTGKVLSKKTEIREVMF